VEANIVGVLAEALTADVEVVLADETSLVSADAARKEVIEFSSRYNIIISVESKCVMVGWVDGKEENWSNQCLVSS
jgi:hypothetical protein